MTNDEAKEMFFKKAPVKYNGSTYQKISAIIYRFDKDGNLMISAELLDRNGISVVIARIKDISNV